MLFEKPEIVQWRHDYLRKISRYRDNGALLIYIDETWVFEGNNNNGMIVFLVEWDCRRGKNSLVKYSKNKLGEFYGGVANFQWTSCLAHVSSRYKPCH